MNMCVSILTLHHGSHSHAYSGAVYVVRHLVYFGVGIIQTYIKMPYGIIQTLAYWRWRLLFCSRSYTCLNNTTLEINDHIDYIYLKEEPKYYQPMCKRESICFIEDVPMISLDWFVTNWSFWKYSTYYIHVTICCAMTLRSRVCRYVSTRILPTQLVHVYMYDFV